MTKPKDMSREEYNAKNRAWRAEHRDEANAKRREYYKTHKKELTEINRRWDKKHADQRKAARRKWMKDNAKQMLYNRKWNEEHKDKRNAYGRKSFHKNKELTREIRLARAHKRRANVGTFTKADIQAIFKLQRGECVGCNFLFCNELRPTIDHVHPVSRGGSNWPSNLQLLCSSCNDSKGAWTMEEWRNRKQAAA